MMDKKLRIALSHLEEIVSTAEEHHDDAGFSCLTLYPMDIEAMKFIIKEITNEQLD